MAQPDSIVPDPANPQAWNRYAYSFNNPLRYTDPTGHKPIIDEDENGNPIVDPFWHPGNRPNNKDDDEIIGDKNNSCNTFHVQACSDTNLYLLGWENFNQAWSIYWNPNATVLQRLGAGYYIGAWGGANAGLVVGGVILTWEALLPGSMSCIGNPACQEEAQRIITNTQITGRLGQPISLQGSSPATINGLSYSGHAVDRMLQNGIPPSAVQNVVQNYTAAPGNLPNTLTYFDPVNNIRVITNAVTQIIITLGYGKP